MENTIYKTNNNYSDNAKEWNKKNIAVKFSRILLVMFVFFFTLSLMSISVIAEDGEKEVGTEQQLYNATLNESIDVIKLTANINITNDLENDKIWGPSNFGQMSINRSVTLDGNGFNISLYPDNCTQFTEDNLGRETIMIHDLEENDEVVIKNLTVRRIASENRSSNSGNEEFAQGISIKSLDGSGNAGEEQGFNGSVVINNTRVFGENMNNAAGIWIDSQAIDNVYNPSYVEIDNYTLKNIEGFDFKNDAFIYNYTGDDLFHYSKNVTVSNVTEMNRALDDKTVDKIVFDSGIYNVGKRLDINEPHQEGLTLKSKDGAERAKVIINDSENAGTGSLDIKVENVTIEGLEIERVNPDSWGQAISVRASDVRIFNNTINGVNASDAQSKIGVMVIDSGEGKVTKNILIVNNTISNFHDGLIVTTGYSGNVEDVNITNNRIQNTNHSLVMKVHDGNETPQNIRLIKNSLTDFEKSGLHTTGSGNEWSGQELGDFNGSEIIFKHNTLDGTGLAINHSGSKNLSAAYNWWGTEGSEEIQEMIEGEVEYTPWCIDSVCSEYLGVVETYLNNSRENITIEYNTSIMLNGSLIHGEFGSLNLTVNGTGINDSVDSNVGKNYTFDYPLGSYNVTTYYYGSENYTSAKETWNVTVEDTTTPVFIEIPENETSTYNEEWGGVDFNATDNYMLDNFSVNDNENFTINSTGFLNWTGQLGAAEHYVNVSVNDTSGNTNWTMFNLNVTKADGKVNTYLDNSRENMTIEYNTSIMLNGSLIHGEFGSLNLTVNGTGINDSVDSNVSKNYTFDYPLGSYNVTTYYNGSENYTSAKETWNVTVEDTTPPVFIEIPENETITYNEEWGGVDFNATDNYMLDNFSVDDNENFTINSTGFLNWTGQLGAAEHYVNVSVNDTSGNTNWTMFNLNVTKADGKVNTYLDNSRENITIEYNTSIMLNGSLIHGEFGSLNLTVNGTGINDSVDSNVSKNYTFDYPLGSYNVTTYYNGSENYTSANETWNVTVEDTTSPVVELEEPVNELNSSGENIEFKWNVTDNMAQELDCSLNINDEINETIDKAKAGETITTESDGFSDGVYNWSVDCSDYAENVEESETRNFTVDTTKPNVELNQPINYYNSSSDSINFNWTATDNLADEMKCDLIINEEINESAIKSVNDTYTNYTVDNIEQGQHSWSVNCTDDAGNVVGSDKRDFNVDTSKPNVELNQPTNYYNSSSDEVNFNWTATDNLAEEMMCDLIINEEVSESAIKSVNDTSNTHTVSNVEQGHHNWSVNCTDDAGNVGESEKRDFTVDIQEPGVALEEPINYYNSSSDSINFNWTATDNLADEMKCDLIINEEINESAIKSVNDTYTNYTVDNIEQGQHSWSVNCTDDAGNSNQSAVYDFTVDTTNPPIELYKPIDETYFAITNVTFNWTATDNIAEEIKCDLIINDSVNETLIENNNTVFEHKVTNLAEGYHNWSVNCTDDAGNFNETETRIFGVDTTDPVTQITSPEEGSWQNSEFNVEFSDSDEGQGLDYCEYRVIDDGSTSVDWSERDCNEGISVDLDDCSTDGEDICKVESRVSDFAGNSANESRNFSIDTGGISCNIDMVSMSNYSYADANTLYYNTLVSGSFNATASISTTVSGTKKVDFPNTVSGGKILETEPFYRIYNWDTGDEFDGKATVETVNNAGTRGECDFYAIRDITPPKEGYVEYPNGFISEHEVEVEFSAGIDDESGINESSGRLQIRNTTLEDGECNTFGDWTTVYEGDDTASPHKTETLADGKCYQFQYKVNDNVENEAVFNKSEDDEIQTTKFDTASPRVEIKQNATQIEFAHESIELNWSAVDYSIDEVDFNVITPSGEKVYESSNEEGQIELTPKDLTTTGKYEISLYARDKSGNENSTSAEFEVVDTNPPKITTIPDNETIEYGTKWDGVDFEAQDPSGIDQWSVNDTNFEINETGFVSSKEKTPALGKHIINVSVEDNEGNLDYAIFELEVIDTIPPYVEVEMNATELEFSKESINISWNSTDLNLDSTKLNITCPDNEILEHSQEETGEIILTPQKLEKTGEYEVSLFANDTSGNENSTSAEFEIVDTIPPEFTTIPENKTVEYVDGFAGVDFEAQDPSGIDEWSVNDTNKFEINATGFLKPKQKLALGIHRVNVSVTDNEGNKNWVIYEVEIIDTTVPNIELETPKNNSYSTQKANEFSWNATDRADEELICELIINEEMAKSNISSENSTITTQKTKLEEGVNEWSVNCSDSSGNWNKTGTRILTVDTTQPKINLIKPGVNEFTQEKNITFSWNATDTLSEKLSCDLIVNSKINVSSIESGNDSITSTTVDAFDEGLHNWSINCTDNAGNSQKHEYNFFKVDTTPPQIVSPEPEEGGILAENPVNFSWKAIDQLSHDMDCKLYINNVLENETSAENNTLGTFSKDMSTGNHNWSINCVDKAGNEASAFNEFILDLKEPAVKLGLPKDNYETGETNVEFNCSAKDNFGMENLTIFVWDENKEINFTDTTEDTNKNAKNSWTIELEHGNFEWNCQAFDSAGKKNWAKNNKSLSIHTIPPEITESSVENISSIGAELSWQTDNPADSVVYYGKNPGKLNKTEKDDRFKTEHNIKLHYLKEETTYYYKTGSCDEFGNCKNSTVESFETDPVQPPELESHYPHYEPIILNDEEQDFYVEVTDPQGNDYFVEWYLNGEKVESGNNYTYVGDEKQGKFEHEIKVNATNLQRDATITWNLTQTDYPVTKELDGDTTDLSKEENLEDVTNLTMEKTGTGKISFGESAVNLSGIANLDPFIRLENGVVGLNSKLLKSFEQPATIYMYGLNFSSIPDIYHSENFTQETEDILNECPEDKCSNINYNAATGILSFDVSGFSVFRATINTGEMPKIDEPEKEKKASRPVKVPHLRFAEEIVKPGEEATLHINLDNLDYDDIEGLRVKLGIPELGVQRTKGPFDLEHSDNVYKQINLRVPEYAQPGLYNARITVTDSNNKVRRTIHRDLTVR